MQNACQHGDVLIRDFVGGSFQLLDAATHEQIAIVASFENVLRIAADRGVPCGVRTSTTGGAH